MAAGAGEKRGEKESARERARESAARGCEANSARRWPRQNERARPPRVHAAAAQRRRGKAKEANRCGGRQPRPHTHDPRAHTQVPAARPQEARERRGQARRQSCERKRALSYVRALPRRAAVGLDARTPARP